MTTPTPSQANPLVSVVISTYNEAESGLLQKAVRSVVDQTYTNWECIIVGDATSHAGLIESFLAELNDDRIRFVNRTERGGPLEAGARPKRDGVPLSSGEYLCFLDADDQYTLDHIEALLRPFLDDPQTDLTFGNMLVYCPIGAKRRLSYVWHGKWNNKMRWRMMNRTNFFGPSTAMIKRTSYDACGGIQPDGFMYDWRLWQRLIRTGHDRFCHVPKTVVHYYAPRLYQFLFLRYISWGLPFNMQRAAEQGKDPNNEGLVRSLYKG